MPLPPKSVVMSKQEIGRRLQALRQERRMTQVELAEVLGAHAASISQVERGIRGLTVQQIVKLARALKVSTDTILGATRAAKEVRRSKNPRLLRRLDRIEELPAAQRRAVLKILDGLLDTHRRGDGKR